MKVSALRNGKPFSAVVFVETTSQDAGKKKEKVVNDHTGAEGKVWKLYPGVYDVTVINSEDAGRPVLSFPGIVVEAGKTIEQTADFSGGGLKVRALRNGKPFSTVVFVETTGQDAGKKKERVVNDHSGVEGKIWKLSPGVYDVTVTNPEDAGRPVMSFPGITIEAGKTIEKTAEFSGGGLRVIVLEKGKPVSAVIFVEKTGDTGKKERIVNDHTGMEGRIFNLSPGVYEITITNQMDPKRPIIQFSGVQVEAGKTVEKTAQF